MNPALAASEFHGRVGSAGPDSSPAEAEGLAQSCVRAQARFPQRPDWPDPQSQSFSRSYGSNLPTSLTYMYHRPQRLQTFETGCGYGYGYALANTRVKRLHIHTNQ